MSTTAFVAACAQIDPVLGDLQTNIAVSVSAIERAVEIHGARVVVLPECTSAGYAFVDAAEAAATAQSATDGPTVRAWQHAARRTGALIAGGITESAHGRVYNSAVLVGPQGTLGVYRKVHLWNDEKRIFTPGDLGFPVVTTPFGRIGLLICYDAWFPESMRSLALAGADLVCAPSDWVPVPGQDSGPTMATMMTVTGAHSNQLYVVACSRVGTERGVRFIGSSIIAGHTGWPVAGPASPDSAEILAASIDPVGSRSERLNNPFNQPLRDRRPHTYRTLSEAP